MAQGPTGRPVVDAAELERMRAKLDGFEAMGLQVGALRELLAKDPEAFKSTYMAEIRRQLEGAQPSPAPPSAPSRPIEEVEVRVGPPSEEQIEEELELEGAGPEEALRGPSAGAEGARAATTAAMPEAAGQVVAVKGAPVGQGIAPDAQVGGMADSTKVVEEGPEAKAEDLKGLRKELKEAAETLGESKAGLAAHQAAKPKAPETPTEAGPEAASGETGNSLRTAALLQAAVDYKIMVAMQAQQEESASDKQTMKGLLDELEDEIEGDFDEAGDAADIEDAALTEVDVTSGAENVTEAAWAEATAATDTVEGVGAVSGGSGAAEHGDDFPDAEPGEVAGVMEEDGSKAFEVSAMKPEAHVPEASSVVGSEGTPTDKKEYEKDIKEVMGKLQGGIDQTMGMLETGVKTGDGLETDEGEAPPEAEPATGDEGASEAEAPPRIRSPRTPRRRPGRAFAVTAVVAVLVVGGLAGYFTLIANDPPFASFSFAPEEPVAGQPVTFDASDSRDPDGDGVKDFRWAFGDAAEGKGRVVKHAFNSSGDFTVTLKVLDGRGAASRVVRHGVHIEPLRVEMSGPHVDDDYRYDVVAYLTASNPDGLYRFSTTLPGGLTPITIVVKVVRARLAGDKTSTVDGVSRAEDGFMREHDVREETMTYDLDDVQGEVLTNQAATDTTLSGYLKATLGEKVCLGWDRSVRTDVDIDARFTVPPNFIFTERDTGTFYGQLEGIASSFSLASFLRSTEFDSEDRAPHQLQVGGGTYIWRVRGMEMVEGRSAWGLHVNVTMSEQTLTETGLDAFFMDVWLEPGLSQPAKSHVHTKAYSEGDTIIVDVTETLLSSRDGATDPGTACSADHAYTVRGEFADDFAPLGLVPEQGGVGGGFAFTPQDAVEAAAGQVTGFQAWLDAHPSAFCHDGNYSTADVEPTWRLSFGTEGSSEHFSIVVQGAPAALTATGASYIDDGRPLGSAVDIGSVATLSRGIRLLRNQTEVRSNAFLDSNPDWSRFNLTIGEGAQSIPLDPTSIGSSSGAGYVYMLESHDDPLGDKGRYRAGLDATNGQVLFSWTQRQTRAGRIGGVG